MKKKIDWTSIITNVAVIALTGWQVYQAYKGSKTIDPNVIEGAVTGVGNILNPPKA